MGRGAPGASTDVDLLLERLAHADDVLAARALRRYGRWQRAVEERAAPGARWALRRAWERGRDQALLALSAAELEAPRGDGGRRRGAWRSRA